MSTYPAHLAAVLHEVERLQHSTYAILPALQPLLDAHLRLQAAERALAGRTLDEVFGGNPGCLPADEDPDGGFVADDAPGCIYDTSPCYHACKACHWSHEEQEKLEATL